MKQFNWVLRGIAFVGFLAVLLIGYFTYQLIAPSNPLTINKVTITTPVISSTGVLRYDFDYCKHVSIPPIVYRQLWPVDGSQAIPFPSVEGVTVYGCHVANIPLQMIPGTKPGKYRLHGHLVYQVNSFRSVAVDYTSDPFTIQ